MYSIVLFLQSECIKYMYNVCVETACVLSDLQLRIRMLQRALFFLFLSVLDRRLFYNLETKELCFLDCVKISLK
jgi:hypothetical protein